MQNWLKIAQVRCVLCLFPLFFRQTSCDVIWSDIYLLWLSALSSLVLICLQQHHKSRVFACEVPVSFVLCVRRIPFPSGRDQPCSNDDGDRLCRKCLKDFCVLLSQPKFYCQLTYKYVLKLEQQIKT